MMTPEQEAMELARKGNVDKANKNKNKNKEKFSKIGGQKNLDSYMNQEDINAEAKEFVDNGEGQELADYKTSYNSPNAQATQEAVNTITEQNNTPPVTEVPPQTTTPETTTTETTTEPEQVVEEKKEAVNNKLSNIASALGIKLEDLQDMLNRYAKGQFPKGSKPFLIMNSITTGLSNMLAQMDASRANSSLSRIMRGAPRIEPQLQQSVAEQLKAAGIKGQQDVMNKILGEVAHSATETGQLQDESLRQDIDSKKTDNEMKKMERDLKKKYGDREMAAKITSQELINDSTNLDNMDKRTRQKYLDKMLQADYDTTMAALRQLRFGDTDIQISLPGFKGKTNLANAINMVEAGTTKIQDVVNGLKDVL